MFRRIKYQNNHVCRLTNEFSTLNIRINEYLESVITRDSGFGSQSIRNMLNKHCTQIIAYYDRYDIYITYTTHHTSIYRLYYVYVIFPALQRVLDGKTTLVVRPSVRPRPQSGHAYTVSCGEYYYGIYGLGLYGCRFLLFFF